MIQKLLYKLGGNAAEAKSACNFVRPIHSVTEGCDLPGDTETAI